tara:strand:+ start:4571 stop:5248 length:678 start_codon:yes stop_codon:yes gene_type:complete
MKYCFIYLFTLFSTQLLAQDSLLISNSIYKEDQWYASLSFLLADESIEGFRFNGLSHAFSIGFISDIPLNLDSNKALGFGLGYGISNYGSNLSVVKQNSSEYQFYLIQNTQLASKNRLISHYIEVPIEYRWRTSTIVDYAFWRIYTGYVFRYNFYSKSKPFNGSSTIVDEVSPLSHALKISAGYNTWNIYAEYSLSPYFKKGVRTDLGIPLKLNSIRVGLIFYVL